MDIERQMLDDPLLSNAFKGWVRALLADRQASRDACDRGFLVEGLRYWLKRAKESCAAGDQRAALRRLDALGMILDEIVDAWGQMGEPAAAPLADRPNQDKDRCETAPGRNSHTVEDSGA